MPADVFDNSFLTTLSAPVNNSQLTIPVSSAASTALQTGQALGMQFRILIDAERMLVTSGASAGGLVWTVTRGIENTAQANHLANAPVAHVLTVGGFLNHHTIHEPGGADPFTLLDDTNFNAQNKDGLTTKASLRTLGTGAQQATAGNDSRLSNARTPTPHASTHQYNGSDPLYSLVPIAKATNYAANIGDLVLMTGAQTVTLPTAPSNSVQVGVAALNGQVSIARGGSDTITIGGASGQASFSIQTGQSVILTYFNDIWYALQSSAVSGGGGSSGGTALQPTSQSTSYLASVNQLVLMSGANNTVTLPLAPVNGAQVAVYALTSATSVVRSGADVLEFNGPPTVNTLLVPAGAMYTLEYNNGVWYGAGAISAAFTPPARMYRAATFNTAASVWTKIAFDTKSYDPGGNCDVTTNYRYTAPQAGYYAVEGQLWLNSPDANQILVSIYKNGIENSRGVVTVGSGQGITVSDIVQCNAGDYLELWYYTGTASATVPASSGSTNFMAVTQVGQVGTAPPGQGIATQARACRAGALTINSATKVPLDTFTTDGAFDPGGCMDHTNGRYVCPTSGDYQVNGQVAFGTTTTSLSTCVSIYKNGIEVSRGNQFYGPGDGTNWRVQTVSDIIACNAGDYIELWAWSSVSYGIQPNSATYPMLNYLSVAQLAGSNIVGALSPTAQTAPYQAGPGQLVLMTGANTVTLPPTPQAGTQVQVTALTASVPVNRSGTDTINNMGVAGLSTLTVNAGQSKIFSYLGGAWYASPTGGGQSLTPPARAYRNAALSTPSGSTKVPLDSKSFDPGGNFDVTTNNRYVVPSAGIYSIEASLAFSALTGAAQLGIYVYKNGAPIIEGQAAYSPSATAANAQILQATDTLQLVAGDYLELWAYNSVAGSLVVGSALQNFLSVNQIGVAGTPSPGQGQTTLGQSYRNAAITLSSGAWTKLPLDTKVFDPGGNFPTADRYICPTTGYYLVSGTLGAASTAAGQRVVAAVYKTGSGALYGSESDSGASGEAPGSTVSGIIQCNAGDYLELWYYSSAGIALNSGLPGLNFLSVIQVGGTNLIGALSPTAQTAAYSAGAGQLVMMTGQNTVTLPNAPQNGSQVGVNSLTNTVPISRSGTDTINLNSTSGQTLVTVPQGTTTILTYLNGVWYGAGATQTTLAPPARAYLGNAQSLVSATWTKILLDTKTYDPGGNFDNTTNHRWTCPQSGFYQINGTVFLAATAAGQTANATIYKNGASLIQGPQQESELAGSFGASVGDIVQLNAGDYIELWSFSNAALGIGAASYATWLSIAQVAQTGAPQLPPGQGLATVARMTRNASLTLAASAFTLAPFDTVTYDPGSNTKVVSSEYVCPATGYYEISTALTAQAPANTNLTFVLAIYKNGTEASQGTTSPNANAGGSFGASTSDVILCQAGDVLQIYYYSNVAYALLAGSQYNYMSVQQVAGANLVAALSPTAQTANYIAGVGQLVLMTGANTVTLPNAPQVGTQVGVNALTNTVAISRQGADTITYNGTSGQTSVNSPVGATTILTYLNGVWYGAGPTQTTLAPPARAFRTAALTTNAASNTKVSLDTKTFDPGGNFDVTTNFRYVAPQAGFYRITGSVLVSPTATGQTLEAYIFKNGGAATYGSQEEATVTSAGLAAIVSDVLQLAAGDYIELWCYTSAALAVGGGTQGTFLVIEQIGAVGAPQLPPGQGLATQARAYRNAALSLTASTWTKIAIDTVAAGNDPGGNISTANGRYVCPATGAYQVMGQINVASTASGQISEAGIYKNGSLVTQGNAVASAGASQGIPSEVSDMIQCNAGDYIELWGYSSAALSIQNATWNNFLTVVQVGGANTVGALSPVSQTADYTAGPGQSAVMLGQRNYTLPNAPQAGTEEEVVASSGNVTVHVQGTDTINYYNSSSMTQIIVSQGTTMVFRYLLGVWYAVSDSAGNTDSLQNGVVNSGDLALSAISIASGTGAITFTVASGVAWIAGAAGILVRVPVIGQTLTLTPIGLPSNGSYATARIELGANGLLTANCGASTAGTASGMPILSTTTTFGKLKIADVGIYNNAGAYVTSNNGAVAQGTNWFDRRPWARGYNYIRTDGDGTNYAISNASHEGAVAQRVECSGVPLFMRAQIGGMYASGAPSISGNAVLVVDSTATLTYASGSIIPGSPTLAIAGAANTISMGTGTIAQDAPAAGGTGAWSTVMWEGVYTPSIGSHLFRMGVACSSASGGAYAWGPYELEIREMLQYATNGTS